MIITVNIQLKTILNKVYWMCWKEKDSNKYKNV